MSDGGVFNIGKQEAGTISNVAGDQTIGTMRSTYQAAPLRDLSDLRAALTELPLPNSARRDAEVALAVVEEELQHADPDKGLVAARLEHVAGVLGSFGLLATAADRLVVPLNNLAGWLGTAGKALFALLP
jgi:hypothetical protein